MWRLALRSIEPRIDAHVWRKEGYLAGPDPSRARSLVSALQAHDGPVWAARGGYGSTRLLPAIEHALAQSRQPTIFLGFSDLTALFPLLVRRGYRSLHGPVLAQVSELVEGGAAGLDRLVRVLRSGRLPDLSFTTPDPVPGEPVQGTLWGGNLTLCASLCGTPYAPDYDGAILFIEEVDEPPYRIDRMLTQLDLAGVLRSLKALLVGDLGVRGPGHRAIDERLDLVRQRWGIPVLKGLPIGHHKRNACLEVGVPVTLEANGDSAAASGRSRVTLSWRRPRQALESE